MTDHIYIAIVSSLIFILIGHLQGIFDNWYEQVLGAVFTGTIVFCILQVLCV